MAAPHVAGFVAYLLGLDSSLTLASVRSTMKSHALNNVLSGIRKYLNFWVETTLLTIIDSRWHHKPSPQQSYLNVETLAAARTPSQWAL